MSRLKRPADWYAGWIHVGENTDIEAIIDKAHKRRDEAVELQGNIQSGHFDADTLEELIQLLDHECYYLQSDDFVKNLQRRDFIALKKPWTGMLVTELSRGLFQTIYPESCYERELQFRAIFSALLLQRAQGVDARQVDHYEELQSQFQKGHKDLQWQKGWSGEFTTEMFRKYQCSFLLVAIAEYAKNFRREQPVIVDILSRAISLIIMGGNVAAMATTTGFSSTSFLVIINTLNESFRPLSQVPEKRSEAFFFLQEMTRITLAFDLYTKVSKSALSDADRKRFYVLDSPQSLATWILERILSLLNDDQIEGNVYRPDRAWQHILAFFSHGPPCFGDYYYLYGLLDCATQLGRILEKDIVSSFFVERMRKIIRKSKDPSLRWKAIEFLVSVNSWNEVDGDMARVELKVIRDCLNEEIITLCPPRRPSTISSIGSSSTLRDTLTKPQEMNPQEWMEPEEDFQHFQICKEEERVQIPFERCFSSNHYAAGLSPKCSSVFFLSPRNIVVYSLDNFPKVTKEDIRLNRVPPARGEFKAAKATITDRFLALIIRANPSRLLLYEYDVSAKIEGDIGSEVFEMWYPTCLAMHEASNRTWVAVGGRYNLGSIKMYSIEGFRGKLALKRHDALFDKCVPNALANDWPKVVDFSTDGQRLVCLTNKNKVLVWFLSNNARPRQAAFEIMKPFEAGTMSRGIESVSLFYASSNRPYVLCTTSPSDRRNENGGEWPFISPVHSGRISVPKQMEHSFFNLGESLPIIAGAVSTHGNVVAMLENTGNLILCSLARSENGGICPSGEAKVLKSILSKHKNSLLSSTSLRFHLDKDNKCVYLFAVDIKGKVIRIGFSSHGL